MADTVALVKVLNGTLKGRKLTTEAGFEYSSFKGIPYAKPPLGELRFQAPQPADSWEGVRDATKDGNISWQLDLLASNTITGDEDCLFINVYTPKLPADGGKDIPVMVFIHGGGFVMGSGSEDVLGPDYLVSEGVILVTLNYRLGPLGFLSLENEKLPGNAGLKDQVAALQWVRDNITFFGGNPNNVTIVGESAGGASVHYLLLSECGKGLFQRAISQSGSVLCPWALQSEPLQNALNLCKVLGHPTSDVDDAFKFLQTVPPKDLVEGHQRLNNDAPSFGLAMALVPTIEKKLPGVKSFITEDPLKIITEGNFYQVPYISGYNSEEGLFTLSETFSKIVSFENVNTKSEYIVPTNIPKEKKTEALGKLKKFYFDNKPVCEDNKLQYSHLRGDIDFVYGINKAVNLHSKHSKSPVYYYRFGFDEFGMIRSMFQLPNNIRGVCHADELAYFFKIKGLNATFEEDTNIGITHKRLLKLWTNFMKIGNPTPSTDDLIPILWEPAADEFNFLDINADLTMQKNPSQDRLDFLEDLYKSLL